MKLEVEIARLSMSQNASAVQEAVAAPAFEDLSCIMPAVDAVSVDSFRTADTSQSSSRHFGASPTHMHDASSQSSSRHFCASPTHIHDATLVPPQPLSQALRIPFPQFSRDNIEMWFWALEKWFIGSNVVSDDHRFAAVLLALPMATTAVFKERFDNPPASNKYLFAKNLIIKHFAKNNFDQIKALIEHVELGDTKPSELYAQMRQIAGDSMSHATLKGLWIMRLPEQWRPSLSLASSDPLEFLHAADIMYQVTPRVNVCKVDAAAADNSANSQPASQRVSAIAKKKFRGNYFKYKDNKGASTMGQREGDVLCPYHATYGAKAIKCMKPCAWKSQNAASNNV